MLFRIKPGRPKRKVNSSKVLQEGPDALDPLPIHHTWKHCRNYASISVNNFFLRKVSLAYYAASRTKQ